MEPGACEPIDCSGRKRRISDYWFGFERFAGYRQLGGEISVLFIAHRDICWLCGARRGKSAGERSHMQRAGRLAGGPWPVQIVVNETDVQYYCMKAYEDTERQFLA